ncbi:Utp21 specific WD40 associated putative domain-containing protein [Calycina marina]|uniref:Utp21 specific WD40 associated putative domain-containing protein n=1 Tax=Calycina marina TaxID=1763456 RepID=A0A9P7YVU9_9HELO|nr:Utp21 specific WD40 associated putative domain-containing protein [Calycina marina]
MPSAAVVNIGPQDGHVAKRQKLGTNDAPRTTRQESKIFAPFRTIGLVSSTLVPFTSVPLGRTTFQITTSVGRCLQTYDLKRGLQLVFLTRPQTPEVITATVAWKDRVFAAWGGTEKSGLQGLWVFKRGKKVYELELPEDLNEPINKIMIFGTWIVGCCTKRIEVWKSATYEHYTTLFPTSAPQGEHELTGGIVNMPTYLNKVFAGRKDGSVEIWNLSSGKLIYTLLPPMVDSGAVTALQPTPALSLLAISYSNGPLIIHNIRTDKTVLRFKGGNAESPITSISFRTDDMGAGEDGRKPGVMATSGPHNGDVTFWDLNGGGRVMGILRGAHNPPSSAQATVGGGVSKVEFLPGQPVIVTSGLDNSLKSWIFDETPYSAVPRILHSRSGHAAPVTQLQFLPSDADGADKGGKWLLSAGRDRSLWGWSLRRDNQSTELSQGSIRKKAKKLGILANTTLASEPSTTLEDLKAHEIICMASCLNRDGGMGANAGSGHIWQKGQTAHKAPTDATVSGSTGWESVVTGHREDKYARTWFWGRKKAGRWAFETGDGGYVRSVALSPCGTFAVVGSKLGGVDMFNLQSGQHRQRFPSRLTPAQAKKLRLEQLQALESGIDVTSKPRKSFPRGMGKHQKSVTGIVVDSLNKNVITCSLDGHIKFWDFSTGNLIDEINWAPLVAITGIRYHASNDLIALTCDDLAIRVVDTETKRTIRELWGCQKSINDFCFSNDGRWIIAASQDCIIRVWDLPTGHLIDAIRMETQCTALAFSGTGEFLATTCEGQIGVNIWNNKTLFTHVPTRHISEDEIANISAPTVSGEGGRGMVDGAFDDAVSDTQNSAPMDSLEQLSVEMMTLSMVPKSRWQTLLHLDLIKQRNKPTEAPKVPEKAPFFLPSLENPLPVTASEAAKIDENKVERSRIMRMGGIWNGDAFTVALRSGSESEDYTPFITHLRTLPPSAADLAIRSLSSSTERNEQSELTSFIQALTSRLRARRDYELVQAWMAVFLRLHSDAISHDSEVVSALGEWRQCQEKEGRRIGELIGFCNGVVPFLRNPLG